MDVQKVVTIIKESMINPFKDGKTKNLHRSLRLKRLKKNANGQNRKG